MGQDRLGYECRAHCHCTDPISGNMMQDTVPVQLFSSISSTKPCYSRIPEYKTDKSRQCHANQSLFSCLSVFTS